MFFGFKILRKEMLKKKGYAFNSMSGRPTNSLNMDMVQSISIVDQEKNLHPFKEKVHLWTTIKVIYHFNLKQAFMNECGTNIK